MANELMILSAHSSISLSKETKKGNYIVGPNENQKIEIERDVDFGVVPGTKQPSLYKSGAEKICMVYQVMPRFEIEYSHEELAGKEAYCFYRIRCDLVKGFTNPDGFYTEVVFTNGRGSANTMEKRNGMNMAKDSANATLKMAEKRALVDAALHLSGLSSMFSQDLENDSFMKKAEDLINENPGDKISKAQFERLSAVAAGAGLTRAEFVNYVKANFGYTKVGDITIEKYPEIIESLKNLNTKENDNVTEG